jgi:hypothetical protein
MSSFESLFSYLSLRHSARSGPFLWKLHHLTIFSNGPILLASFRILAAREGCARSENPHKTYSRYLLMRGSLAKVSLGRFNKFLQDVRPRHMYLRSSLTHTNRRNC